MKKEKNNATETLRKQLIEIMKTETNIQKFAFFLDRLDGRSENRDKATDLLEKYIMLLHQDKNYIETSEDAEGIFFKFGF